jgi:hypothetical protein
MSFFVSLLLCSFDLWRAPLLSSQGTTVFPFWPPCPTPLLPHSPTRFSENFTRTNTYKHNHHISSPHTPGFTISSKCQTRRNIRSRTADAWA